MILLLDQLLLYKNIFADQNLLILCQQNDKDKLVLSHEELYNVLKKKCVPALPRITCYFSFIDIQCDICVTLCPDNGPLRLVQVWNLHITYYVVFPCGNALYCSSISTTGTLTASNATKQIWNGKQSWIKTNLEQVNTVFTKYWHIDEYFCGTYFIA